MFGTSDAGKSAMQSTTHERNTLEIRPHESLAVEFTSSWHFESGTLIDEIETQEGLASWIDAYRSRLGMPTGERISISDEDVATALRVRAAVRALLDALVDQTSPPDSSLELVTECARRVDDTSVAWPAAGPHLVWPDATATIDKVTSQVCASVIRLITSPRRDLLRRCPAPSCVLFFSALRKTQQWCSPACGNRARVARHSAKLR
jgi:predicted RNA-binding Zn ribbon-like protein